MTDTNSYQSAEHPQEVVDCRSKFANAFEGLKLRLTFPELVNELGLRTEYKGYEDAIGDMFDSITSDIPSISPVSLGELSRNGAPEPKKTLVEKFKSVAKLMCDRAAEVDALPKQYARMPYDTLDGRNISMDNERFPPPDVAFVFKEKAKVSFSDVYIALKMEEYASGPDAYRQHIARLVDYALALWNLQPTRTFVPVLFLHGCQLDLLVFTRRGYFVTCVGPVLLTGHCDRAATLDRVAKSLRRLWFLLTLPAHQFGFLFGSPTIPRRLQIDASTIPVTMKQACDLDSTTVIVERTIVRPVQITGRCTYLFNAKYSGEEAVLKLTWTCTDRLPEGAVYRVLEAHGVSNIPKIYMSGVIVKDFDGYRLELLVMEHCGSSIGEHIQGMAKSTALVSYADELVKRIISNVSTTLTEALAANILHRDISSGNIAIKDDTAYVIDWGCAKLLCPPTDTILQTEIANHWSFNWDEALATEKHKDSSTGTPMYMSARLLLRADTRGIYDDLESLLYVILDALSNRPRTGEQNGQPLAFRFYDSSNMAATRLMCIQSDDFFLEHFGVRLRRTSTLEDVLDAMRRFLFFDGGNHLCSRILEGNDFPRTFDSRAAAIFMSDKTARDLLHLAGEQGDQYSLSVETAATTARAQIPGHDPKSVLLPPPSFSVRPVGQGALGDDDDIIMDKTAVHISNSEVVPGCLPSARSGTQSTQAVPHISEQPESPASTCSTRSRHTPFNKSAISGNNTNADDSNDKQLDEWRVITRSRSKALVSNTRGLAKKDIGLVGKTKSKPGSPPKGTKKRESDDKVKNIAWRPAKRRKL